jgi:hypothetical protein
VGFVEEKVDTGTFFFSCTSALPSYLPSTDVPYSYAKRKDGKPENLRKKMLFFSEIGEHYIEKYLHRKDTSLRFLKAAPPGYPVDTVARLRSGLERQRD